MRLILGNIGSEPILDLASQKRDARRDAGRDVQAECWKRLLRDVRDPLHTAGMRRNAAILIRRARAEA